MLTAVRFESHHSPSPIAYHASGSMDNWARARDAIRRGIEFLRAEQGADGGFISLLSDNPGLQDAIIDSENFTTAQVCHSLVSVSRRAPDLHERVRPIVEGARTFLRNGATKELTWKYWTNKTYRPIDPDCDVTACAAAAFGSHLSAAEHQQVQQRLLAARGADGLFVTWMRGGETNDVDAVVNANVVWFLRPTKDTQRALDFVLSHARHGSEIESAPYYESPLMLHYVLTRAVHRHAQARERIAQATRERLTTLMRTLSSASPALEWALCGATQANLETVHELVSAELLTRQSADGSWAAAAAWNGPELPAPRSMWWGARAWTTALALEALSAHAPDP